MRLEYKYLIPNSLIIQFRNDIRPFVDYDKHIIEQKDYIVRSIYFDNRRLDYYYEKIEGIKVRKKVRIRGYNFIEGKNLIFLEIKRKFDNFIYKNRTPIMFEDLNCLFENGDIEKFINEQYRNKESLNDGKKFFYHFHNNFLRPVILVVYEREAFFCKFDERLRITFDKDLRYLPFPLLTDLYNDTNLSKVLYNSSILEIKFKHCMPAWLQNLIHKYGLTRSALSKYVICLDDYAKCNPINNIIREAFSNYFPLDKKMLRQGTTQ